MTKYVMGIDNGGTVTKACLYDETGNLVGTSSYKVPTLTPHPLWTERDTEAFWQSNVDAIKGCIAAGGVDPADIAAISLTGHGNGIYLSRADGSAPWPGVISTDGRAQEFVDEWHSRPDHDEQVRQKTLSTVYAGQPAAMLAWFDKYQPQVFEETDYVFLAKDYIRYRLSGVPAIEESDGSIIALMDITRKQFDRDLMEYFGIGRWFDKLPPLVASIDVAGRVSAEAAALTGLVEGTPIAGGAVDVVASAMASGVVKPQKLAVVTGTWSINEFITPEPIADADPFLTGVYALPGTWLILEASPNGVSNFEWFMRQVLKPAVQRFGGVEIGDSDVYRVCEEMIRELTPSMDDPFFLPFINGSSVVPDGRAGFVGLLTYHDIRHMVRAVYEGVVFSHMYDILRLRSYGPLEEAATFTGGAANSELWTQMYADALGSPLQVVDAPEAGTLGVAIMGAVAAGIWPDVETAVEKMVRPARKVVEPDRSQTDFWRQRYERYAKYLETQR